MRRKRVFFGAFTCLIGLLGCATNAVQSLPSAETHEQKPIVIAHRGASGYLPEHTLPAALLAFEQGADYIEQDLVLSRDGELVVLHDIHIDRVTNVADMYPLRKRADGRYYAIDFDLAELKQLAVHERKNKAGEQVFPHRYSGNAAFTIATFNEQIELIKLLNSLTGKDVGIYAEIKSPGWHQQQGYDISAATLKSLEAHGLNHPAAKVYLQCFDFNEVKRLKTQLNAKVKLIQLLADNSWGESDINYDALMTEQGLAEIAQYAVGIGPWLNQMIDPKKLSPSGLHALAKQQGLLVHPYTFRSDSLPQGIGQQQLLDILFTRMKVDGVFTDQTDVVRGFLDR
ncbi:glycerophosphodiester phosphodiesterase [Alteromonas facilis]|uniref:glycerophosphodiester phosphodiesterase n=1 Tax=Alteromonas facilis TaxID=2048004 RepID=UPI000C292023|nr:glycerophosphodiester phosphodiesterase [Alteromonas facilis]